MYSKKFNDCGKKKKGNKSFSMDGYNKLDEMFHTEFILKDYFRESDMCYEDNVHHEKLLKIC
jgi:hypothetical protein